ncbi:Mannan polymerase II complex GMA12 subunit [Penicillium ucsense]|uniref:Mannan polymerase II complex GMA12 subunit n=1 Tax=Penicillium ucsense TaxID=2839758 RepID=A0A8J8WMF0_9EURO|nr:Mannan polymerase II complex GMA12 subunit [Penicillium ucsense]KAF7738748.1 Mannan polymerase II complex GMA12 subunit [Penicillium ucsense]
MQFALPPRKSPHELPGHHSTRLPLYRRKQLKTVAVIGISIFAFLYILSHIFSSSSDSLSASAGTAGVVIVTVLDRQSFSEGYISKIIANREDYAKRHGYTNFFASVSDYQETVGDAPKSWALVPAMRHALATYPKAKYFFHTSPHALIMNPTASLTSHILDRKRLESLMMKDASIVPPNGIIKTFPHLKEQNTDLVITQDSEGLRSTSFILKNGEFARFFLDLWFDPLFRTYNFVKAETHALDHILQWHPTVLARTALIPQRTLNAYSKDSSGASPNGTYRDGDLIISFPACDKAGTRDCQEFHAYYEQWLKKVKGS